MIARIQFVRDALFEFVIVVALVATAVAFTYPPPAQAPGHNNVELGDAGYIKSTAMNLMLRACDWEITDYGIYRTAKTTSDRTELRLIGYNGKWYRY